jgi:molybdate transport system permease protein
MNLSPELPPRFRSSFWKVTIVPYLVFILVPIIALLVRASPVEILENLKNEQIHQAIRLSLTTSTVTVLLTLLLGTPVAYYLSHPHLRLHGLVDTLVDLPTVLPPAVAGVALLMAFGRRGLIGSWLLPLGIEIPFTPVAVVLAQLFIAAPLYIKTAAVGFSNIDWELKKAAALDGANRWQTFRFVVAPNGLNALLSGSALTWARALGEFGATIIFAGNFPGRTQTMPLAIYIGFEIDLNVALTLAVILIGISFAVLLFLKIILSQRRRTAVSEVDW